ncbi:unnamed protein product [Phytophthora lilii]|uniref:Unnamed protein product n=1 Tax=Phytophthora lilii TaxID=2077276 RepID=A0A9W6TE20_9STRA|nr:unnamed protein product [Phytophthora lilii]
MGERRPNTFITLWPHTPPFVSHGASTAPPAHRAGPSAKSSCHLASTIQSASVFHPRQTQYRRQQRYQPLQRDPQVSRLSTPALADSDTQLSASAGRSVWSSSLTSTARSETMLARHVTKALRRPAQTLRFLATAGDAPAAAKTPAKPAAPKFRKKKTFQFSGKDEPAAAPLEEFEYPSYWDEDYPADFDSAMKHEVEKLQIFADFTPYLDLSWQQQIHPKFDGAAIRMTLNCPLEDFDERLFVDDKTTYDTKVAMEVPLSCWKGLDQPAKDLVAQLAGPRYNANKKLIKITEDRYNTRVFNHKRICDILRELTETALELSGQAEADKPKKAAKKEAKKAAKKEAEQ